VNHATALAGLTASEAQARLVRDGPNAVKEETRHPLRLLLQKFWAPVPWMLEATIVLQLALGRTVEAAIIGVLLVFNSLLSFAQENRANRALALLKSKLSVQARVLRDGRWILIPSRDLVAGDVIHLRLGDLVPADTRLAEGDIQLDQSALTGESLPIEAGVGATAYAGAIVKRGEATGEVAATGPRTYFGKTAELVRTATIKSHLEQIIFTIVKYLLVLDGLLVITLLAYALVVGIPLRDIAPFALILLVASVPVALPATFTLAGALGALELAGRGVLVTRLSAIEDAASMDILASDKTGTITQNQLSVRRLVPIPPNSEADVLRFAALASDDSTQDPIDLAILDAARRQNLSVELPQRLGFIPFDPATRRSEAIISVNGEQIHVVKGARQAVCSLTGEEPDISEDVERLAAEGYRVLAVAKGPENSLRLVGLAALDDPPRSDSRELIQNLHERGVRVLMVTGDNLATAQSVAREVGVGDHGCAREVIDTEDAQQILNCDVFARVYPEDKFRLVQTLQRAGHVTGMTGDGVNDAPALKQAEIGIAVASATDVAKAAASVVLTEPGLSGVLAAVEISRQIYQRMLTYTLNKIVKTLQIAIFLSIGLMLTRVFVVTPLLIVLLLFANDFVTMSIAVDRVSPSRKPERWNIPTLMRAAAALALPMLLLSFAVFFFGRDALHLAVPQLQTLVFLLLVFTGQGTVYLVRERSYFWHSAPSRLMLLASVLDIAVVSLLATRGILMAAIPPALVAALLGVICIFLLGLDALKVWIFRGLFGDGRGR
jgi:H+-transporting ATPase